MTLLSRRTIRLFTFALAASVFSFALNIRAAEQKAPPVDKKAEAKVKKDAAAKEKAAAKEAKAKAKADAEAKAKADADAKAKAKADAKAAAKTQKPAVKEQPMVKADKPAEQDRSLPLGALTLGARAGDDVVEGYGDFILPVARISSGLLFISPRATFSDDNEEEYNLGLGYRYLVPDKKVIVGGNVYYDYRSTEFNNGFDQLGLGVELLTEWVDARANYYKPEDDRAVAREYDVETISQSEWNAGWGDPYANNNAVLQDYIGPVRRIETLTQHYIEYEQALEGFDAEIGVKLPIPTVSDYADVKVFGGYYYFDAKFGGEDIEGLKGRLEVRAARSIYLDAEVYEDEELYGSDYFVGARMVLPFSVQNFADGRNPFEGGAAGLRTSKQKQAFESRLTEMVMRDLHVQTELSQAIEDVTQQTETHVTKQLNKSPSNTIVLASDVTFVDGDNSGFEDGSAEHPWNTMGEGVGNAVGDTVYVWDAKDPYQENIGLPANMILWGSGCVMAGADGKVFGNGIKPEVVGTALGPTLTVLGDDVTIRGFHIEHEDLFGATPGVDPLFGFDISEAGIYGANVTRTTIACNYIDDCTYGVLLVADNVPVFEATFMNNYAEDCEQDGFHITVGGGTPLLPSMVVNEAYVKFDGDTSVDNDDDGFDVNLAVMDTAVATFKNVTATDNDDDGLDVNLEAFDGGVVLTVDPSTFNENGDDGIQAYLGAEFATLANIAGVTANGNDEDGIDVDMDNGGIGILLIGPDASLMELVSQAFGDDAPDVFEDFLAASGPVTASGNGEDGFDIWMGSSFLSLAGIFDATANENGENGMYGSIYAGEISALLMVPTETLMPLVGTGVDILDMLGLENLPEVPDFTPHGPITANGNGENGIDFLVEADNALMTLMNASASGNKDEAGVEFHIVGHDGIAAGLFAGINANGNDEDGLRGEIESWGGPAAGLFFDFSANGNGDDGLSLDLRAHNNVALFAAASLDPVRYLLGMLNDSDLLDSDITLPGEPFGPVSVSGNGGDGMDVSVRGEGPAVGLVLDVLANGNYGDGIDLNIRSDASDGIGVVGSSDVLFELADLVIGGMGVAPTALPEDFPYMGNLQANGNGGGGVRVRVEGGESGVMLGMGGISANGNTGLNGDFNDGINAVLTSDEGPSDAFIGWVAANGNAGAGVTVRSETEEDAGVMIVNATANGNGGAGVRASVTSRLESIDVFLGGINANGNSNRNVAVIGYAGTNTARVGLMNIQANGSESGPGVYVDVASPNGSVQFGAGSNMYGFLFGPDITELVEDGGIDANGNDDHGMIVNLSARDGVLFAINDVSVNGNGGDGLHVEALSTESAVEGTVGNVDANGNSRDGVDVYAFGGGAGLYSSLYVSNTMANGNASGVKLEVVGASGSAGITASSISANGNTNGNGLAMRVAGLGAAGTAAATAIDTTTDGNENDGVNVQINASGLASFFGQGIRSHGNDNAGVRINAGSGVAAYNLDMGGGLQGSTGQGSISGNANRDLRNAGGGMVMAENNYWGANPPLNSQFAGSVDRDPWLTTDPGP